MGRVTNTFLAINIVAFIIQIQYQPFTALFMLQSSDVLTRPWILTSTFLHGSTMHLLFNMFILFFFGPLIEARLGSKRFIVFYLLTGIFASLIASFFYEAALGASGALMGVLGVTAMLAPNMQVLLWGVVPMRLKHLIVLIVLTDIFFTFSASNIATFAHFAGLSAGLAYGYTLREEQKRVHKLFEQRTEMSKEDLEEYMRNGRL